MVSRDGLVINHLGRSQTWEYRDIQPVERKPGPDGLRLKHRNRQGARMIIPAGPVLDAIILQNPKFGGDFNSSRFIRITGIIAATLILLIVTAYGVLNYAPGKIAKKLPASWRVRLAETAEQSILGKARECNSPAGKKALLRLASRVASGTDYPPDFTIRVFDKNMLNAFALPDGRIVLTSKLVELAQSPEEIAGVVAHEMGHVTYLHPEAGMVRLAGLQIVLSILAGGTDTNTLGTIAGLTALLRYTRSAEIQADDFALSTLVKAKIDPGGMRSFFEKVKRLQGKHIEGTTGKIIDFLSTHPVTEDRIKKFKPLPATQTRKILSAIEFANLKKICSEQTGTDS